MNGNELLYIVLILVCLIFSGFFASSETAFLSLQKVRLEQMLTGGVRGAGHVANMIKHPGKLLAVVLLGTNLFNTAAAALGTVLAISLWGTEGVLIATVVITILLLILSETTPKTIAAHHAERIALIYTRPLGFISWLFTPFVLALNWIASGLARIIGGAPTPGLLAGPDEIRTMISLGHKEGTVEEEEARLLHKVFDFGDRTVREVMVPRPEVVAITQGATVADFLKIYAESPLSRFPVYKDDMDNVVGTLAVKDVLMALARGNVNDDSSIDEIIRPAYFTPESKHIDELFAEMRAENYRMCVVVDEYGDTVGIVSLSRLVEEIVGEVGDELAGIDKDYEIINEHTFQIDGSMRIEEANEEMGLDLPKGDEYETVAGFILKLLGHVPKPKEQVSYHDLKITITEMKGLKIEKVLVVKKQKKVLTETRDAGMTKDSAPEGKH